jgi:hypothetical protein
MPPKLNFILVNRFNEALDRLLGMEGEPGMDTLGPELVGSIILQNDRDELKALQGERLSVGMSGNVAAVVAQNSFASLQNPPGSGLIATVTAAFFDPTTTQNMTVALANWVAAFGAPVAGGQAALRDTGLWRTGSNNPPTLQVFGGANGAITGLPIWRYSVTAAIVGQLNPWNPVVLRPGSILILWDTVQNEAILASGFAWLERPARADELLLG